MERPIAFLVGKVSRSLQRHRLLHTGDRVLVALSGGSDSVALLLALLEQREELSLEVSAAHVNHGLRGESSDRDEVFVRQLCSQRGLNLEVTRVDTRAAMKVHGENLEACARRLRYAFLFETALRRGCIVATGHTLNDQAETFLMKVIRGAGLAGLSGIRPRRVNRLAGPRGEQEITVIRPLLDVSKQEVRAYLDACHQVYREDTSNRDLSLDRNWVRHRLIPMLEARLNPNLLATLERTIELCRDVNLRLEQEGEQTFDACNLSPSCEPRLSIPRLSELDPALQRQIIRRAIEASSGDLRNIALTHVEGVRALLSTPSGRQIHLPGGLRVQREFEELFFTRAIPAQPFCYFLTVPGEVFISQLGKRVRAVRGADGNDPEAVLIRFPGDRLTVRSRLPGDRYRLTRQSGEHKLKELFQKRRVPRSQRDRLVVVEGCGRILWVEGFPSQEEPVSSGMPASHPEMVEIRLLSETSTA